MKKIITATLSALALAGLVAVLRYHPRSSLGANQAFNNSVTSSLTSTKATYRDGNYVGQTVDVGYGPVQVKATISGGRISNVRFLQMPNDREHTREISAMAKPILLSETLTSQSANIDIVSGATQTSEGYIQSLQDALSRAQL